MNERLIIVCSDNLWRRLIWPGGVYYIDFYLDTAEIMAWIKENIKYCKIVNDRVFEHDQYEKVPTKIYKIFFKNKTDFIAFKLRWL